MRGSSVTVVGGWCGEWLCSGYRWAYACVGKWVGGWVSKWVDGFVGVGWGHVPLSVMDGRRDECGC